MYHLLLPVSSLPPLPLSAQATRELKQHFAAAVDAALVSSSNSFRRRVADVSCGGSAGAVGLVAAGIGRVELGLKGAVDMAASALTPIRRKSDASARWKGVSNVSRSVANLNRLSAGQTEAGKHHQLSERDSGLRSAGCVEGRGAGGCVEEGCRALESLRAPRDSRGSQDSLTPIAELWQRGTTAMPAAMLAAMPAAMPAGTERGTGGIHGNGDSMQRCPWRAAIAASGQEVPQCQRPRAPTGEPASTARNYRKRSCMADGTVFTGARDRPESIRGAVQSSSPMARGSPSPAYDHDCRRCAQPWQTVTYL